MTATERTREVRLGLVMYGGVSLAIYMNGVAAEFFRAVRGRGAYKLIKDLTDSDVAIDVISGTSAGGINGVFLAFALCNGREFGECAQLWREDGDIAELLRKTGDIQAGCESLLDSESYYGPKLASAFEKMWGRPIRDAEPGASPMGELDLFVTGTDFNGRISTQVDAAGHAVDVKDHRSLFWLKHRPGRKKNQLDPSADAWGKTEGSAGPRGGFEALAKLARITSCFPGAFAPVRVTSPKSGEAVSEADRKLAVWGKLPAGDYVFLDGGVIDNKPFTSTLRTIFYRTADRPVRRLLIYVEPDPERFTEQHAPRVPTFLTAALDSVTRIPSYETIADDLRLVAEHNDKLARYDLLHAALGRAVPAASHDPLANPLYVQARVMGLGYQVVDHVLDAGGRSRLEAEASQLTARMLAGLDTVIAKADARRLLANLDASFLLRRLVNLTYPQLPTGLWKRVNRHIHLLEILIAAMERTLDGLELATDPASFWVQADRRLRAFLEVSTLQARDLVPNAAGPFNAAVLERDDLDLAHARDQLMARASRPDDLPLPDHAGSLLVLLDAHHARLFAEAGSDMKARFEAFATTDERLFPVEFVTQTQERDRIQVVRFSPYDANKGLSGDRPADQKVCGDTLAHFGAFLKRSWRSNDILWGRLDGACQLTETLLDRARLDELLDDAGRRDEVRARVLDGLAHERDLVQKYFPHADPAVAQELTAWLVDLLGIDTARSTSARSGDGFKRGVTVLIEAQQAEILAEDLPSVVKDAVQEQATWNQFATSDSKKAEPSFAAEPWRFRAGDGDLDRLVIAMASSELAERAFARWKEPGQLVRFLRQGGYKVGSENALQDVPRSVLLSTAAHAMLVLRACLLGSTEASRAQTIRNHLAYKLFVHWPLTSFDAAMQFLRHSPQKAHAMVVGGYAYLVLAAVANLVWSDRLYAAGAQRTVAMGLFAVAPSIAGLIATVIVLTSGQKRPGAKPWRKRLWRGFLALGSLALLGGAGYVCKLGAEALALKIPALAEYRTVLAAGGLVVPLALGLILGGIRRPPPPGPSKSPSKSP